ncbi:11374_t:CDS:10 [Diversispora eburnea]|uniref:11374_t:CDS:1 n=1 Tax=Diversispora eburnea TaxID=1213867 RepID=A0A9N8UXW7_9GLOM|nr:11374_t:CDS:10 [Diversispora eburnea]
MGIVSSSLDENPTLYIRNSNRFQITEISVSTSIHDPYITFPVMSTGIAAVPITTDLLEFIQDPNTDGIKADVKGLTFINVSSEKELSRIVTVEFNDDPNVDIYYEDRVVISLHKHPNVTLVGNYHTDEVQTSEVEWSWKWLPPHNMEEIHQGWRNYCCFAEYDEKDNTFQLLASFTFWVAVADGSKSLYHRTSKSAESFDGSSFFTGTSSLLPSSTSTLWSPNMPRSVRPSSPDTSLLLLPSMSSGTSSLSSGGRRNSDDLMFQHEPEDGPLFRATLSAYEKKNNSLRNNIKRILKAAINSRDVIMDSRDADEEFVRALQGAAVAHPQAFQPVLDNYLEEATRKISSNREILANQMTNLLIEPLRKLYENDIKVAESKKKDFEDESRDYYQFLSKYLSLKIDSAKEKKQLESDSKYQGKRKNFELKRFDYYAYMQDLHGGRKDQEILYHLINFAEKQSSFFQQTAMGIQSLKPGLDKLSIDVAEATKEIHLMRKEREERRRATGLLTGDNMSNTSENRPSSPVASSNALQNRFKGIRDLEHHDSELTSSAGRKKEGFLFATSRATQHGTVDPIAKNNWHKYWCVLAGGQLCEYSNWKKSLETHNEPINLRFATVREARGADRRFCFEVITPQYRRIYQATSAEDMNSWITVISNAIESLLNGTSSCRNLDQVLQEDNGASAVNPFARKSVQRRGTLPSLTEKRKNDMKKGTPLLFEDSTIYARTEGSNFQELNENDDSVKIIEVIKGTDSSNTCCADCGARRTEWCSINLGIVLCIECSGIHRSLGTHISKIRSLTLDTTSYTPDLIQLIKSIGNSPVSSKIERNEDKADPTNDSREVKQKFIIAKYIDRAFVNFSLVDEGRTATDILFEAVKENNILLAIQAIALKADVNALRRFEVTNDYGLKTPLLLALLHIDPSLMIVEGDRTLFPMAELLLQNGSDVEKGLPEDDLEDMLAAASQPITRNTAKSVGTWAAEVVSDMKKSRKTVLDLVQDSGNIAAIRYFTPKVLARGPKSNLTDDPNSLMITNTNTGAIVGGTISERKHSSAINRAISVSTKKALS